MLGHGAEKVQRRLVQPPWFAWLMEKGFSPHSQSRVPNESQLSHTIPKQLLPRQPHGAGVRGVMLQSIHTACVWCDARLVPGQVAANPFCSSPQAVLLLRDQGPVTCHPGKVSVRHCMWHQCMMLCQAWYPFYRARTANTPGLGCPEVTQTFLTFQCVSQYSHSSSAQRVY